MKLYLLSKRSGELTRADDLWEFPYDKLSSIMVRAKTPKNARLIASTFCGDEGKDAWLLPKYSSIKCIKDEGLEGVIIQDFHYA
jgi:hypothetical protein